MSTPSNRFGSFGRVQASTPVAGDIGKSVILGQRFQINIRARGITFSLINMASFAQIHQIPIDLGQRTYRNTVVIGKL